MSAEPDRDARRRRWTSVSAAALIGLAAAVWIVRVRDVGLVGHDSFPIIVTSRVQSFGDLVGAFTEPLMDGRYPSLLYRPLLDLAVAADYGLFALAPLGYQVQSVLWLAGCALMVFLLARRVLGDGALVGPLVALLTFVVFPLNLEVVPVLARRPESMCALFMLAAVWAQHRRADRRMPVVPALFGLCAAASKEPGMVAPALCFATVLLAAPAVSPGDRLRRAGWALVPHAVALVLFLVLRGAVLGGLGGHEDTSIVDGFARFPALVGLVANELFVRPTSAAVPAALAIAVAVAGFGLGIALAWRGARRGDEGSGGALRLAALGVAWTLLVAFPLAVSTSEPLPWYFTLPSVGGALLMAAAAEGLARNRGTSWIAAAVGALLLSAVLLGQAWRAQRAYSVERWERATALGTDYLVDLRRIVVEVPEQAPGITVRRPFEWMRVDDPDPAIAWTPVLADYSVQAWLDLALPERPTRLVTGERPPPEPGVLLIEMVGDGAKLPLPGAHSE